MIKSLYRYKIHQLFGAYRLSLRQSVPPLVAFICRYSSIADSCKRDRVMAPVSSPYHNLLTDHVYDYRPTTIIFQALCRSPHCASSGSWVLRRSSWSPLLCPHWGPWVLGVTVLWLQTIVWSTKEAGLTPMSMIRKWRTHLPGSIAG